MTRDAGSSGRRSDGLVRGTLFNAVAQASPLLAQLVITPLLVRELGMDGFGVWSLILVFLGTLTTLDGGVGASLARFFAVHAADDDREGITRLLSGAVLVSLGVGVGFTVLAVLLAPAVVSMLDMPDALRPQAVGAMDYLGVLVALALIAQSSVALLQAHRRFGALSVTTSAGAVAFVVAAITLLSPGSPVGVMVWVVMVRYGVVALIGFAMSRRHLRCARPLVPLRAARVEFGRYAARMQVSSLTSFVNGEADALIVGAMLPIRYVGLYAVGYQVATATRSLPLYAFPPMLSRLSAVFARSGVAGAGVEFARLQQQWAPPVLGYGLVAGAGIIFAVPVWLGGDYALAGVAGAVLAIGYTAQGALTGVRTCYVRAVGRPGLETRYALVSSAINLTLTVPLVLVLGLVGVVTATTIALIVASLYFVRLCRPLGLEERWPESLWLIAAPTALVVVVAGELGVRAAGWQAVPGLLAAGVPVLAGCAVLAGAALRLLRRTTVAATVSEASR